MKEPFWIEKIGEDGEVKKRELSVRRSRAYKMWKKLRSTQEWKGSSFHEPEARIKARTRHEARQTTHEFSRPREVLKAIHTGAVSDQLIDEFRDQINRRFNAEAAQ